MSCGGDNFSSLQDSSKTSLSLGAWDPYPELKNPADTGNYSLRRSLAYPLYPNNLDSLYSQYVKPKDSTENYSYDCSQRFNNYADLATSAKGFPRNVYETYTRCACAENKFNNYYQLDNTSKAQQPYETYNHCSCSENRFNNYNLLENTSKGQARNQYETYQPLDRPLDTCRKGTYQSLSNNWHTQKMYEL